MGITIYLHYNQLLKSTFYKYLASHKSHAIAFSKHLNEHMKDKYDISKSWKFRDRSNEEKWALKCISYIRDRMENNINLRINRHDNEIFQIIRRKYYKLTTGRYDIYSVVVDNYIMLFCYDDGKEIRVFDICSRKEYDRVVDFLGKGRICCLATKHALERIHLRGIGPIKNALIPGDISSSESNVVNYINTNPSIKKMILKEKYKVFKLLNNNLEESDYYTDGNMTYVISNKVLLTSYCFYGDRSVTLVDWKE